MLNLRLALRHTNAVKKREIFFAHKPIVNFQSIQFCLSLLSPQRVLDISGGSCCQQIKFVFLSAIG